MKLGVICLFIFLLFTCGNENLSSGSYELSFDSALWKNEVSLEIDDNFITLRQKMLGDLANNHLLGKSRKELINLLGIPSDKMDPDGSGPTLSYPTGPERDSYFAIDSEWLIVEFNEQGAAQKFSIRAD